MPSRHWRLTPLEHRIAPALIQWDGGPTGNGTDWHIAENWLGDIVPGEDDTGMIGSTGTNPAIAINGSASILSLTSNRSIIINSGGSLNFGSGGSVLPSVVLAGGTLDFQNGTTLSSTTIDGVGSVVIPANRDVQLALCTINVPMMVLGHLSVSEDIDVNAGLTLATGGVVQIIGDSAPTIFAVTGNVSNHGTIELTSVEQSQTTRLKISNGTLTNETDGKINMLVGTGGTREIQLATSSAQFTNGGQWLVQSDATVTRLGSGQSVTTSGAITVDSNRMLTINTPTTLNAGSISGGGQLLLESLQLNANVSMQLASVTLSGLTGTGQLTIPANTVVKTNNKTNLQGPIVNFGTLIIRGNSSIGAGFVAQAGSIVRIQGEPGIGTAVLHSTASWTNNGTIELTSAVSANNASFFIDSGSFVNAANGTIKVFNGAGGSRTLSLMFAGSFSNQGKIALVDASLTASGQPLTNVGTLDIGAGTTLSTTTAITNTAPGVITGTGTIKSDGLSGSGTIAPGSAAGTFTVNSNLNLGGKLAVDLNGKSQFDQLKVQGAVNLSGPLEIHVNYSAQVGDEFLILDNDGSDSITGNFASLNDGDTVTIDGTTLEIDYQGGTGNDVTLKVINIGPPPYSANVTVNDGSAQRSLVTALHIAFTEPPTFPDGTATAFQLERLTSGQPANSVAIDIAGSGTMFTITFVDPVFSPGPTKSLVDGNYSLRMIAAKIQGGSSSFNEGMDLVFSTFRLFGDANGDRIVTAADFSAFRLAYGGGSSIFDFDGDGGTSSADFNQFRLRYGVTV